VNPYSPLSELDIIGAALQKYNSYGSEWEKVYFDEYSGGYVVVDKQRIEQGNINKQEKKKYDKEYNMCLTLAKNGYQVEYLKITEGSFDIYLNGISADLKKTSSHNNMVEYAKKAIRGQGARRVVFEFVNETDIVHKEILKLKNRGINGLYYFAHNKKEIYEF
jgi:hypothetical protein